MSLPRELGQDTPSRYLASAGKPVTCHHLYRDMLDASPGVSWDDIAGLAEAKRVLQENVILPLYMPEYFQGIRRPVKVRRHTTMRP